MTQENNVMSKQLLLEFERGGQVTATLLEDEAPKTCKAVSASLPIENKVIHAKWAGDEIFFDGFPLHGELEYENATNDIKPGDVAVISTQAYLPSLGKGKTSFCIFYGKSRPRKAVDETVDVNVFARIDDIEKITEIARRVRFSGSEKILIKVKP